VRLISFEPVTDFRENRYEYQTIVGHTI